MFTCLGARTEVSSHSISPTGHFVAKKGISLCALLLQRVCVGCPPRGFLLSGREIPLAGGAALLCTLAWNTGFWDFLAGVQNTRCMCPPSHTLDGLHPKP